MFLARIHRLHENVPFPVISVGDPESDLAFRILVGQGQQMLGGNGLMNMSQIGPFARLGGSVIQEMTSLLRSNRFLSQFGILFMDGPLFRNSSRKSLIL